MDINSFLLGAGIGFCLALIIGWLWRLMGVWIKQRGAYRKPQVVVHVTEKTPAQVRSQATSATLKLWTLYFLLAIVIWILIEWRFPEFAEQVRMAVGRFWTMIFGE